MLLVPDVNGTKLIHQQWNPPPLCTEFTKVSLRVEARHDIKRSTLKSIANLSTWLHPPKRTMVHLNIPSWKRRNIYKGPFFLGGGSMAFFGVYPEHHDCMDFTVDIEQGIFQQLLKDWETQSKPSKPRSRKKVLTTFSAMNHEPSTNLQGCK